MEDRITKREELMYRIMGKLYEEQVPVVFKGALITKVILKENGYMGPERETIDIDANWTGNPPTMENIVSEINRVLKKIDNDLEAVAERKYNEKQSAGISIISKSLGNEITSMDIDIKPVTATRSYWHGNVSFRGTTVNHIICDKLSALSGTRIFSRAKDMIDIYALSRCVSLQTADIFAVANQTGREIGSFESFLTRMEDMEHAYNKLRRVSDKPPFQDVYTYIKKFILPFKEKSHENLVWSCDKQTWESGKYLETSGKTALDKWQEKMDAIAKEKGYTNELLKERSGSRDLE